MKAVDCRQEVTAGMPSEDFSSVNRQVCVCTLVVMLRTIKVLYRVPVEHPPGDRTELLVPHFVCTSYPQHAATVLAVALPSVQVFSGAATTSEHQLEYSCIVYYLYYDI